MLNFKDSDRESVISYLENTEALQFYGKDDLLKNLIDTPTRVVNHSNEFLGQKMRVSPDKFAKKGNLLMEKQVK